MRNKQKEAGILDQVVRDIRTKSPGAAEAAGTPRDLRSHTRVGNRRE